MALYIKYSAKVYSIYLKYFSAADIHVYSVDEVFIDATPYRKLYPEKPHDLVRRVIQDIYRETGITATGGIGTNMYLAKVAMDIVAKHKQADRDGVRIAALDEDEYCRVLWSHRPITDFWQVAGGIAARLSKYGMYTMGDVAEMSLRDEELLYQIFGIDAELLIDHAWGIEPCTMQDIKNYHTGNRSLSNGQVLPRAYSYEEAELAVKEQAELLSLSLLREGLAADSMTIYIGYEVVSDDYVGTVHLDGYGRRIPPHGKGTIRFGTYTDYPGQIIPAAVQLFKKAANPTLPIRRIFLTLNNIRPEGTTCYQLDLFHDSRVMEKERNLSKAILHIKDTYGPNAVLRGMSLTDCARTRERNTQIGGHRA